MFWVSDQASEDFRDWGSDFAVWLSLVRLRDASGTQLRPNRTQLLLIPPLHAGLHMPKILDADKHYSKGTPMRFPTAKYRVKINSNRILSTSVRYFVEKSSHSPAAG